MKNIFFAVLPMMFAFVFVQTSFCSYTREETYQYLKDYILGAKGDSCESWGSKNLVNPCTTVLCDTTVVSPTFTSWLISIDNYYHAGWGHPVDLYFVDNTNLQNYIKISVQFYVENIEMEYIERCEIGGHAGADPLPENASEIPFADPNPNLKAIIIGSTCPQEVVIYNDLVRVWCMLKYLGYSDIRVYLGMSNNDDEERDEDHRKIYPDGHPLEGGQHNQKPPQDFDGDGNSDVTGIGTKNNIITAFQQFGNDVDEDDIVFVYMNGHGREDFNEELQERIYRVLTYGGDKYWTHEIYQSLLNLDHCAELFVVFDHCQNQKMFFGNRVDYENSFRNAHFIVGCLQNQLTHWDHHITYQLYSYFTYYFTSYILEFYPHEYESWEDNNGRRWYLETYPYLNNISLHEGGGGDDPHYPYHNHDGNHLFNYTLDQELIRRCYDGFCQEDQNGDGVKSFREAFEFAWARIPGASSMIMEPIHQRYHNFNMCTQDPFYFWTGYDNDFYPENDSSGTATLIGRGGMVNWCREGHNCSWISEKKYIVGYDLIFPQMNNAPTTSIGGSQNPVHFQFTNGTKLVIEREVNTIDNVHFTALPNHSWNGIVVNDVDCDFIDCEISLADNGLSLNAGDIHCVELTNVDISDCVIGINNSGTAWNADFTLNGCTVTDCEFWGAYFNFAGIVLLNGCEFSFCSCDGIYSDGLLFGDFNQNNITNCGWNGMTLASDSYVRFSENTAADNNNGAEVIGDLNHLFMGEPDTQWPDGTTNNQINNNAWNGVMVGEFAGNS